MMLQHHRQIANEKADKSVNEPKLTLNKNKLIIKLR